MWLHTWSTHCTYRRGMDRLLCQLRALVACCRDLLMLDDGVPLEYRGIPGFSDVLRCSQGFSLLQCMCTYNDIQCVQWQDVGFLLHGKRTAFNPSSMQRLHTSNIGENELTSGSVHVHEILPSKKYCPGWRRSMSHCVVLCKDGGQRERERSVAKPACVIYIYIYVLSQGRQCS